MTDMWVWGIDLSTKAVDFAFIENTGKWQTNAMIVQPKLKGGQRLVSIEDNVQRFAAALCDHFPPLLVCVELPTGRFPSPHLTMACGAVLAGLHRALFEAFAFPVSVHLLSVSEWKKAAVGRGNATKEDVMAWATQRGYKGTRQDPADALGIASAGAIMVNRPIAMNAYWPEAL